MESVKPTLLIVSDSPDRPEFEEAIGRTGLTLEVRTAGDIPSATTIIESEQVDCIVSAYEIPDENGRLYMGGLRLLEYVRREHGELPFIIFTFVVNEDSVRRATTNGVTAYIRDIEGENVVGQLSYHINSAISRRLTERRADEQARINEIIRDVNDSLVREQVRDEMIRRISLELTTDDVYRTAGFVFLDRETERIDTWTSGDTASLNEGERTTELVSQTLESGSVTTNSTSPPRIAIPVVYEETRYGVLVLETNASHVFYETERAVLGELGETIGHALNAIDVRNSLVDRERELSEQKEQLEQFASIVTHEIRNPLNVAKGNLAALQEEHDDEGEDPEFEYIERSLERIDTIVDDILALVRTNASLDVRTTALERVVEEAWDTVETDDAILEIGDGRAVEADPSQLRRLFENLFRNSIEHATPPDGRLTVSVYVDGDAIVVQDDGVGIDEAILDDIFEMGMTGAGYGTGLGMAIVSDLAERHGWTVTASNYEDGARFRIRGLETKGVDRE
ncbi:response regulator [Natrarchaeobius halalkaliphilus]|uniref:histidine kinase n=1 Tax=Natrarchaeobius halalkaliphilus TaxID=1679091 RepID=A0A3N6LID0_9EURY|nr:ATP-binding protein [Natrarchaeobius halalkaliphilus]RQG86909.1 response regulator [Natrarchaeobius halalkaliphilus]